MGKLTQGPDPHPKKPKTKAPPGACDRSHPFVWTRGKISVRAGQPLHVAGRAAGNLHRASRTSSDSPTAVIVSPGGYGRNYTLLADVLTKYPGASAAWR